MACCKLFEVPARDLEAQLIYYISTEVVRLALSAPGPAGDGIVRPTDGLL